MMGVAVDVVVNFSDFIRYLVVAVAADSFASIVVPVVLITLRRILLSLLQLFLNIPVPCICFIVP